MSGTTKERPKQQKIVKGPGLPIITKNKGDKTARTAPKMPKYTPSPSCYPQCDYGPHSSSK